MKILYHANCNDGMGAALAAWLYFYDTDDEQDVEYIPVQYGNPPPDVTDEIVYILDFSYPRDVILQMATVARDITIIDHHKTAQEALSEPFPDMWDEAPLCDVWVRFDMSKSGAVLTWEFFHKTDAPLLLRHIQDRDLWQFQLDGTKGVTKALQIYPEWRKWARFIENENKIAELIAAGAAIDRYVDIQSQGIIKNKPIAWDITGDVVPVYNLPGFMLSDTLHAALLAYPMAPYAVGYFDLPSEGKRVYSLRSRSGEDVDVSVIAKKHGGGGHKHAAGFVVNHG